MMFHEWFDVHKKEHMEAFCVFRTTGQWPEGFIPMEYKESCYIDIKYIIADMALAWTESRNWESAPTRQDDSNEL